MVRALDLKKPPSIAESIDWARALLLLGAEDVDQRGARADHVHHRQAPHRPRPGGRAGRREAGRWPPRSPPSRVAAAAGSAGCARRLTRRSTAACRRRPGPPGWPRGCSSSPTSCAARAWPWAPRSCSTPSPPCDAVSWTSREDFREALAATLAKSQEDRHVLDLLFDRFFFRAARARGRRARVSPRSASRAAERHRPRRAARAHPRGASGPAPTARCATSPGWPSRPSAARARARA